MNVFNRIVLVFLLLALAAAATGLAVLAWTVPDGSIDALRDAVSWLDANDGDFAKSVLTAVALLVAFVSLILLVVELLPRGSTEVKVTDLKVGDAFLSTAAIGQRVEEAVRGVPHVSDAKAVVKGKRKGVLLALDLHVDPQADLATVTDEACEAARDVLANQIHVALIEPPRAHLHYRELLLSRARRPETAATVALPDPSSAPPEAPVEAVTAPEESLAAAAATAEVEGAVEETEAEAEARTAGRGRRAGG